MSRSILVRLSLIAILCSLGWLFFIQVGHSQPPGFPGGPPEIPMPGPALRGNPAMPNGGLFPGFNHQVWKCRTCGAEITSPNRPSACPRCSTQAGEAPGIFTFMFTAIVTVLGVIAFLYYLVKTPKKHRAVRRRRREEDEYDDYRRPRRRRSRRYDDDDDY